MLSVPGAPPPGPASLRLNTLQQRSALLANREWRLRPRPLARPAILFFSDRLTLGRPPDALSSGLSDLPFVVMPHPLLPVGLPPAGVAMAMNQMSQLSGLANMAAASHVHDDDDDEEEESKVSLEPRGRLAALTLTVSETLLLLLAVPAGDPFAEPLPQRRRPPAPGTDQPITFQSLVLAAVVSSPSGSHAGTGSAPPTRYVFFFYFRPTGGVD